MAKKLLLVLFSFFVSCSPTIPPTPCIEDVECGEGLACVEGTCLAQDPATCRSDETLPCGPQQIGACRPGVQRCIDGTFETECFGAVTPIAERCNAIDDDCDGVVDNGALTTFYVDRDGDGFGSSAAGAETRQACERPAGFATNASDCNDASASINPTATEICDPADVDEDCDGAANVNCGCANPGTTQACCAGRGSQTCDARDGGATLSVCTVIASLEVCNAIDDDCDGQTDEAFSVTNSDGGVFTIAGGTIELDGGCTVGVGACARTAPATCVAGALTCAATAGTPSDEICNGLDDDCDGVTDEVSATLCPTTGQTCTAGTCACPAGETVCGTSCQAIGGNCSQGTGACTRHGTMLCTNGNAACSAVAGTPSAETCNAIDDDCDGQTDEVSASLCPASGQTCALAVCACPAAQVVCGSSCETLGGACSVGVGACARSGSVSCISGGAACNATAGTPVAESCDGVDNDCDGSIDDGVTVTCYPDGDNDLFATVATASQQCPDPSRPSFGNCPVGFVAPAMSPSIDCSPADPLLYRINSTRADADGDAYCAGTVITGCMGAAPPGRRHVANCNATDDCDDANYWANVLAQTRADADGDGYCTGTAVLTCVGSSFVPVGRKRTAQCTVAPDDCNDASATQFTSRQVRADADGDQYCVGATVTQCAGAAPLPGTRVATTCQGDDCKDDNQFATTTCFIPRGHTTVPHYMACGIGLPGLVDTLLPNATSCPTNFRVTTVRIFQTSGAGTCQALSTNLLRQTCTGFDASNCIIEGDCTAN